MSIDSIAKHQLGSLEGSEKNSATVKTDNRAMKENSSILSLFKLYKNMIFAIGEHFFEFVSIN